MVKRAVVIGINYRGSSAELSGCINDAHNLKAYLVEKQGFAEADIRLMTDDTPGDLLPTKQNILSAMDWLVHDAQPGDSLWFSQSSHGGQQRDHNGDERDGLDETLIPLDYQTNGVIVDDEVRKRLVDPLPAGARLTAVLDMCHSGTSMDLLWLWEDNSRYVKPSRAQKYDSKEWLTRTTVTKTGRYAESNADVVCISGCQDRSTSADAWEEGKSTGAMTYALLKTLRNAEKRGKADITLQRLLKDMTCLLRVKRYSQVPQLSTGKRTPLEAKFEL